MGSGFAWEPEAPSNNITGRGRPSTAQSAAPDGHAVPSAPGSSSTGLAPGAIVAYTLKAGADEQEALVVEVGSSQSRRDNILIRFQDGRERNTSEAKIRVIQAADPQDAQPQQRAAPPLDGTRHNTQAQQPSPSPYKQPPASPGAFAQRGQQPISPAEIQNIPPSPERHNLGFGDTGRSSIRLHDHGQNSMGSSFGWGDEGEAQTVGRASHDRQAEPGNVEARHNQRQQMYQPSPFGAAPSGEALPVAASPPRRGEFVENRVGWEGGGALTVVKGSAAGEFCIGQRVLYKQTLRSDELPCTVLDLELPSTNGAMRTKTFYTVQFEDGRTRQTTRDKLTVPR
uniref:Uncharacterized protein n=1 Tax=Hemiselmis tepida TaxID=464990 RepID=A0A7S0W4V0_9CRYP